jgi:hypothetical protein
MHARRQMQNLSRPPFAAAFAYLQAQSEERKSALFSPVSFDACYLAIIPTPAANPLLCESEISIFPFRCLRFNKQRERTEATRARRSFSYKTGAIKRERILD